MSLLQRAVLGQKKFQEGEKVWVEFKYQMDSIVVINCVSFITVWGKKLSGVEWSGAEWSRGVE